MKREILRLVLAWSDDKAGNRSPPGRPRHVPPPSTTHPRGKHMREQGWPNVHLPVGGPGVQSAVAVQPAASFTGWWRLAVECLNTPAISRELTVDCGQVALGPLDRRSQALPAHCLLPRQWLVEKVLPELPEPNWLPQKWWAAKNSREGRRNALFPAEWSGHLEAAVPKLPQHRCVASCEPVPSFGFGTFTTYLSGSSEVVAGTGDCNQRTFR